MENGYGYGAGHKALKFILTLLWIYLCCHQHIDPEFEKLETMHSLSIPSSKVVTSASTRCIEDVLFPNTAFELSV